jgi:hypothetical protein
MGSKSEISQKTLVDIFKVDFQQRLWNDLWDLKPTYGLVQILFSCETTRLKI